MVNEPKQAGSKSMIWWYVLTVSAIYNAVDHNLHTFLEEMFHLYGVIYKIYIYNTPN
jgi:hypothetical protein